MCGGNSKHICMWLKIHFLCESRCIARTLGYVFFLTCLVALLIVVEYSLMCACNNNVSTLF